jgi:hypothetical protein
MFGLGADAVPDDVLRVLSRFQNGLGNEYVWEKVGYEYTPLWGGASSQAEFSKSISHSITVSVTFYSDVVYESGTWVLANEYKTYSGITNGNIQSVLSTTVLQNNGVKYFADINGKIYKTVPGTTWAGSGSGAAQWNAYIGSVCALTGTGSETKSYGYVNSPNADAYPPHENDGFTYNPLGSLGGKGKCVAGSYTGTGTANRTIALGFAPKIVFLFGTINGNSAFAYFTENGHAYGTGGDASGGVGNTNWAIAENGFVVGKTYQWMNDSGKTNTYLAIG